MHVNDAEFFEIANGGTVNWVVTERGDLLFTPRWAEGETIAHTVLTQGGPVVAAGEALIVVDDSEAICTQITAGSDHYQPDERSLGIGVQAFQAFGITFLSEPIVYGERGQEPEGESHEEGEIDLLEVMRRFGLDGGPGEIAEQEGLYEARQHDGDEHDGEQDEGDGGDSGGNGDVGDNGGGIFRRDITSTSELDPNLPSELNDGGTINSGGRSGGARPLNGPPNSYVTTSGGHTLVYDSDGRLIYDISGERVKMTVWDQAPNGRLFSRDVKLVRACAS